MTRRAAGEGSIYPTGDGRFRGSVELPPVPGRTRPRKVVTGATRREVSDKLTRLRRAVEDGAITSGRVVTLGEWLEHWRTNVADLRSSTSRGYESKIRCSIVPHLGSVRLDKVTPEHLEALYARLSETLAPSSVVMVHRILHRALRVAEQRRRIGRNPADLVQPPSLVHREAVALSRDEALAVLEAAAQLRSAARWQVGLAMGLRQGEALGLCWDAVDLAAGVLSVRTELVWLPYRHGCGDPACGQDAPKVMRTRRCPARLDGLFVLEEPKSARSRRTLPLPVQLVDVLRAWRARQLEERLALGPDWQGYAFRSGVGTDDATGDLVFAQPDGRPLGSRIDWQDWQDILAAAGAPRMGTHGGRHTTATLMLEAGEDLRVVMEFLGHSTITLTANTYQHVDMALKRGAAESIGAALYGG